MRILLKPFDKTYFESLEDRDCIYCPDENSFYYVIEVEGQKAGVVGFVQPVSLPEEYKGLNVGYIQIIVEPDFRGKVIAQEAENKLIEKHKLDLLWGKIKLSNIASLKGT